MVSKQPTDIVPLPPLSKTANGCLQSTKIWTEMAKKVDTLYNEFLVRARLIYFKKLPIYFPYKP